MPYKRLTFRALAEGFIQSSHNCRCLPQWSGARASEELWDQLPDGFHVWFGACGEDRARDVLNPLLQRTKNLTLFEIDQPGACTRKLCKK